MTSSLKGQIKVTGRIEIRNKNTGVLLYSKDNLVVNTGLNFIADRIKDNTIPAMNYIAVGTNATPVLATDTTLGTELDRNVATIVNANLNVFEIETDFSEPEAVGVWKEAGVFNLAVAGVMFNRVSIDYTKTAAEPVNVKFSITFTNV